MDGQLDLFEDPLRFVSVDDLCKQCGHRLGIEAGKAIVGEHGELLGVLHATICADRYWSERLLDHTPWRLVGVE